MSVKRWMTAVTVGVCVLGAGFWLGKATAETVEPGSTADPLVSKSYVDQVAATRTYVDQTAANNKAYVDQVAATKATVDQVAANKAYVDLYTVFRVVNVPAGSTVIGEAGTEIVVRAGKATAITSQLGGLLDVTTGVDVQQGAVVGPQHLLVIPRTDGRGLTAQSDLVLMVKGALTVNAKR